MYGDTALSSPVQHVFHAYHLPTLMHPMDWINVDPAQFVTRVSQIFQQFCFVYLISLVFVHSMYIICVNSCTVECNLNDFLSTV